MTDPNTPNIPQQPAQPKDYDALEKEYAAGEYGDEFKKRMEYINMFPGATQEERDNAKRKWIDEWPKNVKIQRERDDRRSRQEDLGITPGSA